MVFALREKKVIATLVALADVTLRIVNANRFLLLLLLVEVAEVREHRIFLGLPIGFLLLRLHLLVLLNTRLLCVHVFQFLRVLVLLFLDVFGGRDLQLCLQHLQPLLGLQLLALGDIFTIESL